jgi:hypothetical protein
MMETGPVRRIAACADSRCSHVRESMLLTLVLYVVRATQALAGDQSSDTDSVLKEGAEKSHGPASMFAAPFVSARPLADVEAFSATEFRPRKHSLVDVDTSMRGRWAIDAPMMRSGNLAQQMAEFKSESRVRLLTLWQMRGSSLSLQAGKHGAPSLQWSTPWVRRDSASRGLFDRLLTAPARSGGGNSRNNIPRPLGAGVPSKTLESPNVR